MSAWRSRRWAIWSSVLLVVGVLSVVGLVVAQYAPRFSPDLAEITIGTPPSSVTLPGQSATCAPRPRGIWVDCRLAVEQHELHVVIRGTASSLNQCTATYAGARVACVPGFIYTPTVKPAAFVAGTLGLAPERLATLRQRHAWSNLSEGQWSLTSIGVSAVLAVLSTQILRPARRSPSMSTVIGTAVFVTLAVTLNYGLLAVGFVD